MRRREVIAGLAGAAVASPRSASAQPGERVRRIGVLMNLASDDPEAQARIAAFRQELQQLGWTDGRDLRIDYRINIGSRSSAAIVKAAMPRSFGSWVHEHHRALVIALAVIVLVTCKPRGRARSGKPSRRYPASPSQDRGRPAAGASAPPGWCGEASPWPRPALRGSPPPASAAAGPERGPASFRTLGSAQARRAGVRRRPLI